MLFVKCRAKEISFFPTIDCFFLFFRKVLCTSVYWAIAECKSAALRFTLRYVYRSAVAAAASFSTSYFQGLFICFYLCSHMWSSTRGAKNPILVLSTGELTCIDEAAACKSYSFFFLLVRDRVTFLFLLLSCERRQ